MSTEGEAKALARGKRERLPKRRSSRTYQLDLLSSHGRQRIYVTVGLYEDNRVGEIFVATAKNGSMLRTSLHVWAIAVSKSLQYGVSLREVIDSFRHTRCDEGTLLCEGVPVLHRKKVGSSWDAVVALLEAETDDDGRLLATPRQPEPPDGESYPEIPGEAGPIGGTSTEGLGDEA